MQLPQWSDAQAAQQYVDGFQQEEPQFQRQVFQPQQQRPSSWTQRTGEPIEMRYYQPTPVQQQAPAPAPPPPLPQGAPFNRPQTAAPQQSQQSSQWPGYGPASFPPIPGALDMNVYHSPFSDMKPGVYTPTGQYFGGDLVTGLRQAQLQRDAMVQQMNQATLPYQMANIFGQDLGTPQFDFQAMLGRANDAIQSGFYNPFTRYFDETSDPLTQIGQQAPPSLYDPYQEWLATLPGYQPRDAWMAGQGNQQPPARPPQPPVPPPPQPLDAFGRPRLPGLFYNAEGRPFGGVVDFAPGTSQEYQDQVRAQWANSEGYFRPDPLSQIGQQAPPSRYAPYGDLAFLPGPGFQETDWMRNMAAQGYVF